MGPKSCPADAKARNFERPSSLDLPCRPVDYRWRAVRDWYDTARGHSGSGYQYIKVNRGGDGMPYEGVLVNLTTGG